MFTRIEKLMGLKKFEDLKLRESVSGLTVLNHPFRDSGLKRVIDGMCKGEIAKVAAVRVDFVCSVVSEVVVECGWSDYDSIYYHLRGYVDEIKKNRGGMPLGGTIFEALTHKGILYTSGGEYAENIMVYKDDEGLCERYWDGWSEQVDEFGCSCAPQLLYCGSGYEVYPLEEESFTHWNHWNVKDIGVFLDIDDAYEYLEHCEYCGDWYDRDERGIQYIDSLGIICDDCLESKGWHRCEDCGEWSNEIYECQYINHHIFSCGDWLCYECGNNCGLYLGDYGWEDWPDEDNDEDEELMPSGVKVRRKNYGSSSPVGIYYTNESMGGIDSHMERINSQLIGVEIETIHKGKACDVKCLDKVEREIDLNHWDVKEDGSLTGGEGAEFVSRLLVNIYDSYKVRDYVGDFVDAVSGCGFEVNSSCGMHVHLDLAGSVGAWRLLLLAVMLQNTNEERLCEVFGRRPSRWSSKFDASKFDYVLTKRKEGKAGDLDTLKALNSGDHSYMLNITRYNTCEIRLFSSSVNYQNIIDKINNLKMILNHTIELTIEEAEGGIPDTLMTQLVCVKE